MRTRGALGYGLTLGWTVAMSAYAMARQLPRADPELFQRHTRAWARGVGAIVGLEVTVFGAEHIDPRRTYVLMANHQSHIDVPLLLGVLPRVPGFLAKAELRRVPFFGRAMEIGGHVFVERGDRARAIATLERTAREIERSGSIVIFPEGTRSRRREVLPFKKGGFHLARRAGVPIVPIGLRGTAEVLPKHALRTRPGPCEVHIGEPVVDPGGEIEALVSRVRERVASLAALPLAPDRSGA